MNKSKYIAHVKINESGEWETQGLKEHLAGVGDKLLSNLNIF